MKRRTFLLSAAAASAVPLHSAEKEAAVKRARANQGRIFKALKSNAKVTNEALEKIAELGFDGIEGKTGSPDTATLRGRANAAGLVYHGVVGGVHWKQRLSDPDPEVRKVGRESLLLGIKQSKELGGDSVLLVPGKVTPDATHEQCWSRSIEEIRQVIPTAAKEGIRVLIETVWNGFCEEPVQFRDYLDEIDSPWVGAYFDIGNMQKFAPAEEWIRTLAHRTVKLDVKDWGEKNGFCPLGQGDVDWEAVRGALAETGFTGWATREGSDRGIDKTADLMNELLDL